MRRINNFLLGVTIAVSFPIIARSDNFGNIMFLHHSVGSGLINGGGVRNLIASYNTQNGTNLEFWDHGYNGDGIHDQNGTYYNSYNIPYDNTDPIGFYDLFMQPLHTPPDNAFSYFVLPHQMGTRTITHEVFVFKSCFPNSDITSESMLNQYKTWYLAIRNVMDAHPEKIFIPLSPPPLVRSATTPENAARARRFAYWLASSEYLQGHPNIFVYNFWADLAEHDSSSIYYNCLREAYGGAGGDAHPNMLANQTCAPHFVACITNAIEIYSNPNPPPNVTLIAPNGGENWLAGSIQTIAWADSSNPLITAYKLDYSTNAGVSWLSIQDWTSGDPHTYSWVVLAPATDMAYVRVCCRDLSGGVGYDICDSSFAIYDSPVPCSFMLGDINGDTQLLGGDVTYGVRYLKGIGNPPVDSCFLDSVGGWFYASGDVNGNCEFRGSDITRLVAYFKGTTSLSFCHFTPLPPLRPNREARTERD
jgi:hypothetical protein